MPDQGARLLEMQISATWACMSAVQALKFKALTVAVALRHLKRPLREDMCSANSS